MIGAERQKAQHDRRDGDVADDAAVAEQLRRDQPQAERLVLVAKPVIALDEDDVAGPCRGEPLLVEDQQRILARGRVLQDDMRRLGLRFGSREHHRAAVLKQQDGRQSGPQSHQSSEIEPCSECPEAIGAGNPQELMRGRSVRGNPMIAAQLGRAEMDAAMPCNDRQRAEQRRPGSRRATTVSLHVYNGHAYCGWAPAEGPADASCANADTSATSK